MLEEIVRPFQSPNPLQQTVVVSQTLRVPVPFVRIAWGEPGDMPAADGGGFKVLDCDDQYKEASHKLGKPIRIENPSDSGQFVMVAPFETVSFSHKQKNDITISFQKTVKYFGPVRLTGANQQFFNVAAGSDHDCKAEFQFQPPNFNTAFGE